MFRALPDGPYGTLHMFLQGQPLLTITDPPRFRVHHDGMEFWCDHGAPLAYSKPGFIVEPRFKVLTHKGWSSFGPSWEMTEPTTYVFFRPFGNSEDKQQLLVIAGPTGECRPEFEGYRSVQIDATYMLFNDDPEVFHEGRTDGMEEEAAAAWNRFVDWERNKNCAQWVAEQARRQANDPSAEPLEERAFKDLVTWHKARCMRAKIEQMVIYRLQHPGNRLWKATFRDFETILRR
ncbi:hypothetical protein M011DRAFT_458475 [Sporormia fimetaria CBS 119925]|uniref:Uncharacterized protein n=1 Tax=Sporormia fimetaria CBS 119925 TaxID=1340428 RepID=A0A6A6VD33_9PLEO|nr:hypothetical protein M011DRAFT_458475 [Sporormia fimetaria CBS 119925]